MSDETGYCKGEICVEGGFQFRFYGCVRVEKFDGPEHKLSHCSMKAVDFVAYLSDKTLFIEVKDFSNLEKGDIEARFNEDLESLIRKYRESFLYKWAQDDIKFPIHYIVFMNLSDIALLNQFVDFLKQKLPEGIPEQVEDKWSRPIVSKVYVCNINTWSKFIKNVSITKLK